MENLKVSEYLENFDRATNKGNCKSCSLSVQWARERVAQHKRGKCSNISADERAFFAKRKFNEVSQSQSDLNTSNEESTRRSATQEEVNSAVANLFLRTGMAFRIADSPAWKNLIALLNPDYAQHMPSSRTLSGKLLDNQYEEASKKIGEILEGTENLTLTSDGWTNVKGDHIVNFVVKAPNRQPYFFKSINTSGTSQTGVAVADEICKVLEEIGPAKFSAVITDNASVMQSAWKIIEERYPHISAYGCSAHGANLLIKDITVLSEFSKTIKDSAKIVQFINNHHIANAKFEEKRKEVVGVTHKLSSPVPTRWYSEYTSAKDLLDAKVLLMRLAYEDNEVLGNIHPKAASAKALDLIKSHGFWSRLENLVKVLEFPSKVIGRISFNLKPEFDI